MDTVPGDGAGVEPYRINVGLDNQKFRATFGPEPLLLTLEVLGYPVDWLVPN